MNNQEAKILYDEYFTRLYYFAIKLVKNHTDAEEAVIKVFGRFFKHDYPREKAYYILVEGVKNECWNIIKTRTKRLRRESLLIAMEAGTKIYEEDNISLLHAENALQEAELIKIIYECIEQLPPQCRTIFKKFYIDQKKYSDIMQELGIAKWTIKNQLMRGRMLVKQYFYKRQNSVG